MLLCLGAHAQISNVQVEHRSELLTFRAGTCSLVDADNQYYATLVSTNRFDPLFLFMIGEGWQGALRTLTDFAELVSNLKKNESASFTISVNDHNYAYRIVKLSKTTISFVTDGYAGAIPLYTHEIDSMIDKLCTMNR